MLPAGYQNTFHECGLIKPTGSLFSRSNALKTEDRPKRSASPEPVDTAYRKVCKVKDAVVNDCVNKVVNSIPSAVKEGCKVCFQYLKKADDVSFNVVSTVVDVTLGNVVRGLDWLDKSAEMSGAGVRRYLRDGLGIDQATAQNIGDGLEVGMKMLISIVPAKSMNLASNASKRLVKLTPAGGPSNGFIFKFYDENVVYKEIKPTKGKAKGGFKDCSSRVIRTELDLHCYFEKLKCDKDWKFYRRNGKHTAYKNMSTGEIRYQDFTHKEVECFDAKRKHSVRDCVTDQLLPNKKTHQFPDWLK